MHACVNDNLLRAIDEEMAWRDIIRATNQHRQLSRADRRRGKIERAYHAAIGVALAKAKRETLSNFKAIHAREPRLVRAAAAVDFLFTVSDFADDFIAQMRGVSEEMVPVSARGALRDLGIEANISQGIVEKFIIKRANKLKDVPQNIYDQIKGQLQEGVEAGDSEEDMAERIEDAFEQVYDGRARVVARTEAASAYGTAAHEAMKEAGFETKQWLSAEDAFVRPSHAEIDGEVVPIDEPFSNGLMFPGDPDGDPEEVINCRCTLVNGDDED